VIGFLFSAPSKACFCKESEIKNRTPRSGSVFLSEFSLKWITERTHVSEVIQVVHPNHPVTDTPFSRSAPPLLSEKEGKFF